MMPQIPNENGKNMMLPTQFEPISTGDDVRLLSKYVIDDPASSLQRTYNKQEENSMTTSPSAFTTGRSSLSSSLNTCEEPPKMSANK